MGNRGAITDLADQQAALAASLSNQAGPPEGFDEKRLALAANLLLSKRRRAAAKSWPDLAGSLGEKFDPLFTSYARANPMTGGMTHRDDALRFAQHLTAQNKLPDSALRLLAIAESQLFLPTRRGPFISLRLPLLGVFTFRLARKY